MSIPDIIWLYPKNSQVISIQGLQDVTTGLFLDGAIVTATLYNSAGQPDNILNNLPLAYVAGSNGNYQGILSSSFNATPGSGYSLVITATQGSSQAQYSIPVVVSLRQS